jgi:hypothetical protein
MGTAVGLRDQRLRLYARVENGSDGFVRPVFSFSVERWGRIDEASVQTQALASQLKMKLDALVEFADETVVPVNGVMKDPYGVMWWIRGANSNRMLRRVFVGVERVSDELYKTFVIYEANDVLDGSHLVDPS